MTNREITAFSMKDLERAERRIRKAFVELYGCEPGVVFVRDQARRLLTEESANPTTEVM